MTDPANEIIGMLPRHEWLFPRGSLTRGAWETVVDSALPGFKHTGLRVATLAPGEQLTLLAGGIERIVVPLSGSFEVAHSGLGPTEVVRLAGRASVFEGPTDVLYLSSVSGAVVSGNGRVAIAEAPTDEVHATVHIPRADVPVELRGAGSSSRQVHNFGTPGALEAGRIIVCEVITPAGNWSSYPPHKHDETIPGHETELEEIYYFESKTTRAVKSPSMSGAVGFMHVRSDRDGGAEFTAEVRTGDVVLVPHGWHGPAMAPPGYDLYYLNVMAGPGPERAWHVTDHPDYAWIRSTWNPKDVDSRLPYLDQP